MSIIGDNFDPLLKEPVVRTNRILGNRPEKSLTVIDLGLLIESILGRDLTKAECDIVQKFWDRYD